MRTTQSLKGITFAFLVAIFGALAFTSCSKEGENNNPKSNDKKLSTLSTITYDEISYEDLLGFYKATSISWAADSQSCEVYTSITGASKLTAQINVLSSDSKEVIITNTDNDEVFQFLANTVSGLLILNRANTLQDLQNQNYSSTVTLLSDTPNEEEFLYKDIDVSGLGEVLANAMFDIVVPTPIAPNPTPGPEVKVRRRRYRCKGLTRIDCRNNAISFWEASHPEGWANKRDIRYNYLTNTYVLVYTDN